MDEIENEHVRAVIELAQSNDEFHEKTQALEKRLQAVVNEYIAFAEENGVTLQESDFTSRNLAAIQTLVDVEDADPEVKEKADALEQKMQEVVADYIATAEEYGLTLTPEDFNTGK